MRPALGLGLLLCLPLAHAGEGNPPSMDLLLYLAEWGEDREGRLLDPLEMDAGVPVPVATGQPTDEPPRPTEPIR